MRLPEAKAAPLAVFWFGLQAVWGALLGVSLQARSSQLHAVDSVLAYGILAVSGASAAALTQIVTGIVSDRLRSRGGDRRVFFLTGAIAASGCLFWFYSASTFEVLIAATIGVQIAMNVAIGPYQAIIPDYVARNRAGIASAWMGATQSLGNAAGAITVTLVRPPGAVAAVLSILLIASVLWTVGHIRSREMRPVCAAKIELLPSAADLFISRALLYVGFYIILGYMLFYLRDVVHAVDPARGSGIVILIFTVSGALGAALGGWRADRFDRRLIVNTGNALVVLSVVAFAFARNPIAVDGIAAVAGVGWGIFLAADWALGCAILPAGAMATAMALWNLAVAGPQVIAPALTSAALLALHSNRAVAPLVAFAMAACALAAGSLWIWRIPRLVAQPDSLT